jgi:hypothetical protein
VHGFLHLVGYDHQDDKDAADMEQAEREILHRLAIPDPYRSRSRPRTKPARLAARPAAGPAAKHSGRRSAGR